MQLEILEVVEEFLVKGLGGAQIVDILSGKFQMVHGVNELLQAGHNGVAAAVRHTAEEHIKDGDFVNVSLVQIARRHGQLIEIGHGGQIAFYIQHGRILLWNYITLRLVCRPGGG